MKALKSIQIQLFGQKFPYDSWPDRRKHKSNKVALICIPHRRKRFTFYLNLRVNMNLLHHRDAPPLNDVATTSPL